MPNLFREEHRSAPSLETKKKLCDILHICPQAVTNSKTNTTLYVWNFLGSWHRTERRYSRYSYSIGGVSIILMGVSAVDLSIIKISDLMSTPALHRKWYFMKSLYSMESTKYTKFYLTRNKYSCWAIRKR